MEPSDTHRPRLATLSAALRFTGQAPLLLGRPFATPLATPIATPIPTPPQQAFTLQAWVRPSTAERGVIAFDDDNFQGHGVAFTSGRYDDLEKFRIGASALASLRVPAGLRALIFRQTGCTGPARWIHHDCPTLEASWRAQAGSMLVLDSSDARPSFAVLAREPGWAGPALVIGVRRYDDFSALGPLVADDVLELGSMHVPAGLALTVYARPGCQGEAFTVMGDTTKPALSPGERALRWVSWHGRVRSLALTHDGEKTGPAPDADSAAAGARRVGILTAASGHGLCLEIRPPASPVLPPRVLFMNAPLSPERWHHIALCFSEQGTQAYVDGRAVNTRPPKLGFDLSGDWTAGQDYAGEIGLLSIHGTVWPASELAARRFDLPRRGDAGLLAAWTLEGRGEQDVVELNSGMRSAVPGGKACWVNASFPRSLLDSGLGQHAMSVATQRANATKQEATAAAQATLEHARQKAQAQRRQAQTLARAHVHAARIQQVLCIAAGALHRRGPRGALLPVPPLPLAAPAAAQQTSGPLTDAVIDQASGTAFVVQQRQGPLESLILQVPAPAKSPATGSATSPAKGPATPALVYRTTQAIHTLMLVVDDAQDQRVLYWVEGFGALMRQAEDGEVELVARVPPGRNGPWSLVADMARHRLCWSNGREIWSGSWAQPRSSAAGFERQEILVSHGQSPHPIALAVDEDTGDLYWLDKDLGSLRCLPWDSTRVHEVYEALSPREGLFIDALDVPDLPEDLRDHPAVKHKRLYWNAEHRQQLEVAVIDDPGLFCWLQRLAPHPLQHNNVAALEDTHLSGVAWHAMDMPQPLGAPGETFRHAWPSGGHAIHAVVESAPQPGQSDISFTLWNSASHQRKPLFSWARRAPNPFGPHLFDHDRKAHRLLLANGDRAATVSLAGPMLPVEMSVPPAPRTATMAVALSRDGTLAVLARADQTLRVWHAGTGALLRSLIGHGSTVMALATCEIGGLACLLSGSTDGEIRRWNLATGDCLQTLHAGAGGATCLAVTDDGHRLVSAGASQLLQVWHLPNGSRLHTLSGHTGTIVGLHLSADGTRATSSAMDKTVKLWNLDTGTCLRTLAGGHADGVLHAVCSEDGHHLLSIGRDRTMAWPIDPQRPRGALRFGGGHDHVDLGPMWLDCRHGLALALQFRRPAPTADCVLLSLGNGDDGDDSDDIRITLLRDCRVALAIGSASTGSATASRDTAGNATASNTTASKTTAANTALSSAAPVAPPARSATDWQTLTVSMDAVGQVHFCINGQAAGEAGPLDLPRTRLRLHNRVGCANSGPPLALVADVSVLRLWNRALGPDEVAHFHADPQHVPRAPLRAYHRSVMDYHNGRPSLMSGMSDGSTPAVPLFDLAVDKGLQIQTRSGVAHARLVAAQHDLHLAQERAVAQRAAAQQAAKLRADAAHEQNQAHHQQAQTILQQATASAAEQRANALRDKAAAAKKARQRIDEATQAAKRQRDTAEQQAEALKAQARLKASEVKRAANRQLQDAQAEKAKYQ